MNKFILYIFLLLTFPTLQSYQTSCECIIDKQTKDVPKPYGLLPNLFNKKSILEMPNKTNIKRIVKIMFAQNEVTYKIILKSVLLSNFKDQMLITMEKLDERTTEDRLIKCQYDDQYVYIIKTYFTLTQLCQILPEAPVDILIPRDISENIKLSIKEDKLTGNMGLFSKYFDLSNENKQEGAFGKVKEFSVENGKSIVVKSIDFSKRNLLEVFAMKEYSESENGVRFYGCFYNPKTFYIAQEKLLVTLNDESFSEWYHNELTKIDRCSFILNLSRSVLDLKVINWAHNDIKPANFMIDEDGLPHLIDFGFAAKIGGAEFPGWTYLYKSPLRYDAETALAIHDIYSLALTIVAIESTKNQKVFFQKFGTVEKMPRNCRRQNRGQECDLWITDIIVGTLKPNWGEYESEQTDIAKMNLTTLLMNIVIKLNQDLDISKLYERIESIYEQLDEMEKSGSDLLVSQESSESQLLQKHGSQEFKI